MISLQHSLSRCRARFCCPHEAAYTIIFVQSSRNKLRTRGVIRNKCMHLKLKKNVFFIESLKWNCVIYDGSSKGIKSALRLKIGSVSFG